MENHPETGLEQEDKIYQKAVQALNKTLLDLEKTSPSEKEQLTKQWQEIKALVKKLESGRIDIVVIGEISTGKSALINALAGRHLARVGVEGGVTRKIGRIEWKPRAYSIASLGSSLVELVDTPGINEVSGQERERLAREQAARADLVLFVADSDLNELEYDTLKQLIDVHKPVILVLNKSDLYTRDQMERLLEILRSRVKGLIPAENVISAAADPMPREVLKELPGGRVESAELKPEPDVKALKVRILEILEKEGSALVALNSAMFASDVSDTIRAVKIRMRDAHAQKIILNFCILKGAAVAFNPVPVADVIGGFGSDAAMVAALGRIYGEPIDVGRAGRLAVGIAKSMGWVAATEWLTHSAAHFVKTVTLGAGTVLTALPQGMAAAYGSYVVGMAAKYYFQHDCGWGSDSAKEVIRSIISDMDKSSVLINIREGIAEALGLEKREQGFREKADEMISGLKDFFAFLMKKPSLKE